MVIKKCHPKCLGVLIGINGNEIQRCDECKRFKNDRQAIKYVEKIVRKANAIT